MAESLHRATLRRRERILKAGDFKAVFGARARASDGRLVAYALRNNKGVTRLGVSVGKRCGGSVARTRVRRLLREAFRRARGQFPGGYDVVLVPIEGPYALADLDASVRALVPEAIRRFERRKTAEGLPGGSPR
jgi:ribonuclease P protein component